MGVLASLIYGKLPDILFSVIGVSCISGLITWLLGNGKHWVIFGLIYEGVFLFVMLALLLILVEFTKESDSGNIFLDVYIFTGTIIMIMVISIIPTLALAFFGYRLFQKRGAE